MRNLNHCLSLALAASISLSTSPLPVALAQTIEYEPGNLDVLDLDLYLSKGLQAKIIARAGQRVFYSDGSGSSTERFHANPDGAAVFEDASTGGWVYVSNSETADNQGGVGAITFDADGDTTDYRMLLTDTNRNCNGGKTDWNTWISCEEDSDGIGQVYQVDPFDTRPPVVIAHGSQGGGWESFAHDTRDPTRLYAFLTEDIDDGVLQRMTIDNPDYTNGWDILLRSGPVDYLVLEPNNRFFDHDRGTFRWTTDEEEGRDSAHHYYPKTEGMEMDGNILRIIAKEKYGFFDLNLDDGTYTFEETDFDGQPDQLTTVTQHDGSKVTYFTEEAPPVIGFLGLQQVGVWTRNEAGEYTSILYGDDYSAETTGIAFSPNGTHLYFAYQQDGVLFDVTRTDGLSFFDPRVAPPSPEPSLWEQILDWWNSR